MLVVVVGWHRHTSKVCREALPLLVPIHGCQGIGWATPAHHHTAATQSLLGSAHNYLLLLGHRGCLWHTLEAVHDIALGASLLLEDLSCRLLLLRLRVQGVATSPTHKDLRCRCRQRRRVRLLLRGDGRSCIAALHRPAAGSLQAHASPLLLQRGHGSCSEAALHRHAASSQLPSACWAVPGALVRGTLGLECCHAWAGSGVLLQPNSVGALPPLQLGRLQASRWGWPRGEASATPAATGVAGSCLLLLLQLLWWHRVRGSASLVWCAAMPCLPIWEG